MRRPLKILGIVVGIIVLIVVALAIAIPLLFDINEYKDRIAAEVEAETGRALTIDGDLHLSVFPWLGIRTGAMSLAQPDGFDTEQPFASFQSADVRVRLMPLILRREIEVGRIALDGLQLQLERDAQGRDNWSDLAERDERDRPAPEPTPDDGEPFDLERIDVEGITLRNARIAFRDAQAGTSYIADDVNLRTGRIRVNQPVELSLDARVSSGVPQWRGTVAFEGTADYNARTERVALGVSRLSAELEGGALPVERLQAQLSARIDGNLEAERWNIAELSLDATARGGALPDRDTRVRASGSVEADLAAQTAALTGFRFEGAGVRAAFDANGTRIVDEPSFTGRATVEPLNPREVLATLGQQAPETGDPTALTHLQFSADFAATLNSIAFTELNARLDASRLTGRFAVADLERQALRFDLTLDQIDLDRYLPEDTPEAEQVPAGALDAVKIPVEPVRALDAEGTLRIGRMRAVGISSERIEVGVRAREGLVRVHPSTAQLYGGTYTGDITLDVRGDAPRLAMNERLRGIQAGPLFNDLFGEARITGVADLAAQLSATGETVGQMRPTLDGGVSFGFQDGAVQGFDLWHMIADARAVLRGEARPQHTGADETEFGSLSGSGTIRRGVLTTDNVRAQLPFLNVAARGTASVVDETVDFRLDVTVQRVPGVDGPDGVGELQGRTVPVRISGPLDDLSYRVDIAAVLRGEVEERARERIDQERDRLEQRLRDQIRRIRP